MLRCTAVAEKLILRGVGEELKAPTNNPLQVRLEVRDNLFESRVERHVVLCVPLEQLVLLVLLLPHLRKVVTFMTRVDEP